MTIKPSAAAEIRTLTTALTSGDGIQREAAIARLAVIGSRSVDRLSALYEASTTDTGTRVAILRVFESIADPRTISLARRALSASSATAIAAVGVLRGLLGTSSEEVATEALDALVATVTDGRADRSLRLAAYDALRDAPVDVQARLRAALQSDSDPVVRGHVDAPENEPLTSELEWREALAGRAGNDPARLTEGARRHAQTAALGDLRRLIDEARAREAPLNEPALVQQWRELRGQLHQSLALRGSTVALYDLRETIDQADQPLPGTFIAALHAIGDASCLEAIAGAYERSADERWRTQLTAAFAAIVERRKIPARHVTVKRIAARWPDAAQAFSTIWRTTPRRSTRART